MGKIVNKRLRSYVRTTEQRMQKTGKKKMTGQGNIGMVGEGGCLFTRALVELRGHGCSSVSTSLDSLESKFNCYYATLPPRNTQVPR
ncbi:hypothetical protein DIPPA_27831 [Diplonema papillatum]|nr:hypothetical protein DIPPA_27831 [Diplonema papillatum]